MMEGAATVQMVADGTLIVTGVAAGTTAAPRWAAPARMAPRARTATTGITSPRTRITLECHGGPWTPWFEQLFARRA